MLCMLSKTDLNSSFRAHVEEGMPDKIAENYFPLTPDEQKAFSDSYLNTLTLLNGAFSRRR